MLIIEPNQKKLTDEEMRLLMEMINLLAIAPDKEKVAE